MPARLALMFLLLASWHALAAPGDSPLFAAIAEGDTHRVQVRRLLESGAKVNLRNKAGVTPLFLAVTQGSTALAALLLEAGADTRALNPLPVDSGKPEALAMAAAFSPNPDMIPLLLSHNIDFRLWAANDCGPFMIALEQDNILTLRALQQHRRQTYWGCKDGSSPLIKAVASGKLNLIDMLAADSELDRKDNRGRTALSWAVEGGDLIAVQKLIARGARLNMADGYGNTALHHAARRGRTDLARALLDAGADIHQNNRRKESVLHLAAQHEGNSELLELLLERGASLSVRDIEGVSVLGVAARAGHILVLDWCLAHGLDINERDRTGRTPLHLACQGVENERVLRRLLEAGADIGARDYSGQSALDIASAHNKMKAAKLLLAPGAQP